MIELPVIDLAESSEGSPRSRFWRSLSDLEDHPAYQDFVREEFLPGASNTPSTSSRRQFLQLMGASMALAGLTACRKPVEAILPYSRKPEEIIPGIPLRYATSMPFRGVSLGLLVESRDGRPTKIEGNPEHPVSQGAAGVFEQAAVLNLYDPDRSKNILRDGTRSTWNDFAAFARQFSGQRLAVLANEDSSPTRRALRRALAARFPALQWVTYSGTGPSAERTGLERAFGRPVRPLYRFSLAKTIVSFDADFLSSVDRNFVWNSREFAAGRRLENPTDDLNRLYAVESMYSVTGGMADNRLALRSCDIGDFVAAVASRLGVSGVSATRFVDHPYARAIADDLRSSGSASVVLAGETQPAAVHALCAAINSYLGSVGNTVELLDLDEDDDTTDFAGLVSQMRSGTIDALVLLGVNPVYDAPATLDFASALSRLSETIHVGPYVDETAGAARWHIPQSHFLEAWGDGRAYDGTLSVVQPLIAPLFNSKSDLEVLNVLATGVDRAGYDLVRDTWRGFLTGSYEEAWRKVVHDGFLPQSGYASLVLPGRVQSASPAPVPEDEVEVVFRVDQKVLDGSFANNAWLQELPDPTTKIVWDNVALMSPPTAAELGLRWSLSAGQYHVDVASLEINGQRVQLPIWVLPGHADRSITVNLGYGRNIASDRERRKAIFFDLDHYTDVYGDGAISTNVGSNVGRLRDVGFGRVAAVTNVAREEDGYLIATTQDHGALAHDRRQVEKRGPFQLATIDEFRENPTFARDFMPTLPEGEAWEEYPELWSSSHPTKEPAFKDNPYFQYQWGMVIDLNACTGCNACIVACQSENNIQVVGKEEVSHGREMHWLRNDRYFVGGWEEGERLSMVMQPVPCMHCENAPCESVCPVAATVHSPDGTNQMIYNRCIGTRYCANNCPYKVRRFNFYNWAKTLPTTIQMAQNPDVTVRSRGVMEKCSYCIQRVRSANQQASLEDRSVREGEVQTACQQTCPTRAITFGNISDPNSAVSRQRQNVRRYEMLAQLAVKPRTSYLSRVVNPNPALEGAET